MSSAYELRSKFITNLENYGFQPNTFDKVFDIACAMSEENLFEKLWLLSFSETCESALKYFDLSTSSSGNNTHMDIITIPKEIVIPLRNEIRFQYTVERKQDFLDYKEEDEDFKYYYKELIKALAMDKIISMGILRLVLRFLRKYLVTNRPFVEKTIWLLRSNLENYKYGGLKNIGLSSVEVPYLLDKSQAIANFLSLYMELCENKERIPDVESIFKDGSSTYETSTKPFANLSNILKENNYQLPEEAEQEEKEEDNMRNSSTILSQVMSNPDLVDDFLDVYQSVINAGIDPAYIIENSEALRNLLDGYFQLLDNFSVSKKL